ncbi:diadenylate cyclase CdaA [Candidatus Sumerlaeota bacterium]|nr:diadenylate cyclase CdaA [Candidatus Sumerlaeota bacterium]
MIRDFWVTLRGIHLADLVDIALVAALFYTLMNLLRRTRSPMALRGLVAMIFGSFMIYFLASLMNLSALSLIFERFWIIIVLVFVVIFQQDFKSALIELGQVRLFRAIFSSNIEYVDEIVSAAALMAKRKVGALIAVERRDSLKVYADTGTLLDCTVSDAVLRTIFTNRTPLHDGAAVIRNDRIVAAGAILPLSETTTLGRDLGTRHRAAVGLSEETDAIVIIVSEETGIISIATRGQLERGLSPDELRNTLNQAVTSEELE